MRIPAAVLLAAWLGPVAAGATPGAPPPAKDWTFPAGALGPAAVYAPDGVPGSVVLFISGEGGWNRGATEMARQLRGWGALVAGVDVRHCLGAGAIGQGCAHPAEEFEAFAHAFEKRAALARYRAPILVGYSSGANLAYGILREAPAGAFAGAISLGFCAGEQTVPGARPAPAVPGPWIALHGALDQVCKPEATRAFVARVPNGKFVLLPKVGHGYAVEDNWLPQFRDAFLKLVTATTEPPPAAGLVADLPLTEVPARISSPRSAPPAAGGSLADTFVVLLTGDGGFAGLDRDLAGALAARGVPVVAWSTLRYFWTEHPPAVAGRDLARIIHYYSSAWHRPRVLLVGYSFGANVLPFLAGRLPPDAWRAVRGIGLLAPATHTGFEVHVADWIPGSVPEGQPVLPALKALPATPILCIYSAEEAGSLCPSLPPAGTRAVNLPGGHHFDGDSATLAREIIGFTGH
ncbi:MAG: AcvB/VirJ family lysyl-phosphatidylglycerol hydrolase [Gammaproteobacteria bacterium]